MERRVFGSRLTQRVNARLKRSTVQFLITVRYGRAVAKAPRDPHFNSRRRAAPTRQIDCVLAFRELERHFQRAIEIVLDNFAFDVPSQEIGPQELAERGRILRKAAGAPELSR